MPIYDFEKEKSLPIDEQFRLNVRRLRLWQLCCNVKCRRAGACRGGYRQCAQRLADWTEAVRAAALRELTARDPIRQAEIADMAERIRRLSQSMADG